MVPWFISPWEAARFSMEAQRTLALQFLGFAFPKAQREEQSREERPSGEEEASVKVLTPASGIEPVEKKTVAARSHNTKKIGTGTSKRKSRAGKAKR